MMMEPIFLVLVVVLFVVLLIAFRRLSGLNWLVLIKPATPG